MARLTCKITAVGGLRCTDRSLVGAIATPTIRQSKLDRVVIGCSAMDEERDLPGYIIQKAGVTQTIIALGLGAFCGGSLQGPAPGSGTACLVAAGQSVFA